MKSACITFGRMSPPTIGHQKLVDSILTIAKKNNANPMVFLSHSNDPKKNPLSYKDKIRFAKLAFGPIVKESNAKTIIEVMKTLSGKYDKVFVVVGSDRVMEFNTLLQKYNGKEFNFHSIEVLSAGERDPDADGVTGMSASKMRELASKNDSIAFRKGLPTGLARHSQEVLKAVRQGMNLTEQRFVALRKIINKINKNKV